MYGQWDMQSRTGRQTRRVAHLELRLEPELVGRLSDLHGPLVRIFQDALHHVRTVRLVPRDVHLDGQPVLEGPWVALALASPAHVEAVRAGRELAQEFCHYTRY